MNITKTSKNKFNFGDAVRCVMEGEPDTVFQITKIKKNHESLGGGYSYAGEDHDWTHEARLVKNIPTKRFYLYAKMDTGFVYTTMMDETGTTPSGKQISLENLVRLEVCADLPFDPRPQAKKKSSYYEDQEPEDDED